ncbi:dihydrofolate reductase family protein [Bacillus sp. 03113]|uniref:dihydrofolate reductase family protein n=1 Tax=Bacillus sp. 03113 TaxID=2578211 RepID=UPI00114461D0|nr:dihydrofolate reductase family protein [Bacillus sp. 03113]
MSHSRKVVVFIAPSLDGFIARENGEVNWLYNIEGEGDNGYSDFYHTVDTVLMGHKTYLELLNFDIPFPYSDKACYVFSKTEESKNNDVTFINENIEFFVQELLKNEGKNIWLVGGGELITSFLKTGLIDEIIVTIAPVILGKGIPLFKEGLEEHFLQLISVQQFGQFVELHYRVIKEER